MAKLAKNSLTAGLALLIAFFFTSCTEEEPLGPNVPPGHSLYVASAIIAPAGKTETEVNTRVAGDDVPVTVTTGSLGIFRSKGTGYTETLNNKQYTYMGVDKGWQPATAADTLFLNGDDVEVCAYYPYNGDAFFGSPEQILLASGKYFGSGVANPSDSYEGTDICYAVNRTVNAARRATTFEMKHALALLEFRISKEAGYVGDCRITSISIMNPELILGSSIDITNGTYATTPAKGTLTYNPGTDADGILIESTAVTTGALLVPFTPTADGLTIAFTVNGTPVEAAIPTSNIAKVEAGHRYSVKVTMKANSMQVTGVDMMPWDEVGVGGDDYTWYPVEEEKVIDIGLDFVFAPGNLVAEGSKGNITGYHFAAEQGYYTGTEGGEKKWDGTSGNDYFFWNQLDPCDIDASYSNPTRVWNDALDPCRQIKGGMWHTPTEAQLQKLVDSQSVWSTYTMQDGSPRDGLYFGTSSESIAQANQDKYLFLPASGYAMNGLEYYDPDGACFVWSSTPSTMADNAMAFVRFKNGKNTIDYLPVEQSATPVRCVKDKPKPEPIDIGLSFLIAPGNLKATKQTDNTYEYTFAYEQGYYSGDGSSGDYFCWNTLDPTVTTGSSANTWNDALDPCRQIEGGSWYTPTKEQLQALIDAESVWGESIYTMKDGTTVNGRYFGTTTPSKAKRDKYVFLPAAGYRNAVTGNYMDAANYGDYWSATPESANLDNAHNLDFSKNDAATSISNFNRNQSLPIRCVKDKPLPKHAIAVEGLDFYVADGNVVATKQASGGYTYKFADEQGYYSGVDGPYDATLGGDYFCWNTLDPSLTNASQPEWKDERGKIETGLRGGNISFVMSKF